MFYDADDCEDSKGVALSTNVTTPQCGKLLSRMFVKPELQKRIGFSSDPPDFERLASHVVTCHK